MTKFLTGSNLYIATAVVWLFRSLLELLFEPQYWSPRVATDYLAIFSFSLALVLLAYSFRQLYSQHPREYGWADRIWGWSSLAVLGFSWIEALANLGEDWLSIAALQDFFIWGGLLAFFAYIVYIAAMAFHSAMSKKWLIVFLVMVASFTFPDQGGGILTGLCAASLVYYQPKE